MSIDRWMDKEGCGTYYTMEYYSAIKNDAVCSFMDETRLPYWVK